ncbi:MAG: hypothetical protein EP330_07250 [Deltaproteobacteria bacterium]|nr:MAG: hypothetical protein EP330_07250 [Deltaproteobacteria bacterium]
MGPPPEAPVTDLTAALAARSSQRCELCEATTDLAAFGVDDGDTAELSVWTCSTCRDELAREPLDGAHWRCLSGAIWSEVPVVQVLAYRLLKQLDEGWARDLLDSAYLDEAALAWAQAGLESDDRVVVVDSNGTELRDGDSVTLIKDLDVKGANFTAKRGTLVKNIRLGDDPGLVEGRVNRTAIYLKTEFLKKA